MKIKFIAITLFFASGCSFIPSIGPDFESPDSHLPENWQSNVAAQGASLTSQAPNLNQWWKQFHDSCLDQLIERGVANNKDLKVAESRLLEARAMRRVSIGGLLPSVNASADVTRRDPSQNSSLFPQIIPPATTTYTAGFDANWEIDIFGGRRREVEASENVVKATEAALRGVGISLLADVARTYFDYRTIEKRLEVANHNINVQSEAFDLVDARFNAGLVSELDVARSKAQLEATRSQVPALEAIRRESLSQLSVLLGENGNNSASLWQTGLAIPQCEKRKDDILGTLPVTIAVGIPSETLRQRPDVQQAERELAAATARIGVAMADLFPKFSLTGSFGYASLMSSNWFEKASDYWSIMPGVNLPIFAGGRLLANLETQEERQKQSVYMYEKVVLVALGEAENSLTRYQEEQKRYQALQQAFISNQRSQQLSEELYIKGVTDFLAVLDAQRSMFLSEDVMVQSEGQTLTNLVALYKAMGGGWNS